MKQDKTDSGKHPPGLKYLFLTEMWERFGYYLMLGIFTLYLMDSDGMGMGRGKAYDIVGTYLGLVYLTPFLGGMIADKLLGYRLSIIIGGLLMSVGYALLSIPDESMMWLALLFVIVGNGFFKPNISTLLGNLYASDRYKAQKDAGYSIFYMGINIGAFVCNFVAAYMRNEYGWGYAFWAASVGMLVGLAVFLWGTRHIKASDIIKKEEKAGSDITKVLLYVFLPAVVFAGIGWLIPGNLMGSDSTDAFLFACLPVIVFYGSLLFRAPEADRTQIKALLIIFIIMIPFWAVFKQNATALTTFAETHTDRSIASKSVENIASAVKMTQTLAYRQDSLPLLDGKLRVVHDNNGSAVRSYGYPHYFLNLPENKLPLQGEKVTLVSTEIFQSVNPFFIVILTPIILALFSFLKRKGKEPSTPAKMAWGLVITGLSSLVMVLAVLYTDIFTDKASMLWLVACYGVITVGELLISPIGLSLTSKVSPKNITAFMMGGWFLSTSIGNKLSGVLAGFWDSFDNKAYFFLMNFTLCVIASVVIFLLVKWLRSIINQHQE